MNYKSESVKSMEELVYILSVISLIFYSIVYVPQFYVIYKSKSSSGISIWTLLLWTQADIMSLIGTIVLYMHTSIIIVGWYHFIIGVCMIIFVLVYRKKYHSRVPDIKNDIEDNIAVDMADDSVDNNQPKYDIQLWCTVIFLLVNIIVCISLNLTIKKSNDVIGEILGWITTAFYATSSFVFANPAVTFARIWSDSFAGITLHSAWIFMIAQLIGLPIGLIVARLLFIKK